MIPFVCLIITETLFTRIRVFLNPRLFFPIQKFSRSHVIGFVADSISRVDSSDPLTHHDPRDLGLICLVKKRKIHFRIFSD